MITIYATFRYLFCFDADAIRQIANSRKAIVVGLLFVISAGFAREYDGEFLLAEPWHLLLPVVASILACFAMVMFVYALANIPRHQGHSFGEVFKSFLNLFWMTAPLAWLYAIPFERFLSAGGATRANLTLLGIVAVWRVALMVRCVQVLYSVRFFSALIPVMLFSDIVAMLALWLVPGPVFMIMGGVRLTESEDLILGVRLILGLAGYGTILIWLASYIYLLSRKTRWQWYRSTVAPEVVHSDRVSWGVWSLIVLAFVIWIPILPFTQTEQWLRWKSERLIRAGDYTNFAQITREYPQASFPPHWDPPPRLGYGESEPDVFKATSGMVSAAAADWVLDRYGEKMEMYTVYNYDLFRDVLTYSDEELAEYVEAITVLDNSSDIALALIDRFGSIEEQDELTESRRLSLEKLEELSQKAAN